MGMSNRNGNGDSQPATALEEVAERIAARESDTDSGPTETDVHAWKQQAPDATVAQNLARMHNGLISVAQFSEAAIEGGIKMAAEVHKLSSGFVTMTERVGSIVAKTEANTRSADQIDRSFMKTNEELAFLKGEVADIKKKVELLPAMKDMLGDILARLPEPAAKAS